MHPDALTQMEHMLRRTPNWARSVLDVGSLDVNGTYRPMIEQRGLVYVGLDIRPGKNVDVVAPPETYPFEDDTFDVVISGSTMEHVERPWLWLPEVVRVLKPNGLLAILTHWSFPLHEHPKDTFRYMPDGMRVLFDITGQLGEYEIRIVSETDIIGSAFKCVF